MRAGGSAGLGRDESGKRDLAYRVLAAAVTLMRPGRRDWGLAMLAELGHVPHPGERARFALGAARVALFPPRATQPWWAASLGLVIRAVVAGAAIHALAPAAGLAPAALAALPAAGAWSTLTMPALGGRPMGVVLVAQVMVVAGIVGCLVLFVTLVQHYPQVMTGGDHGWGAGVASMWRRPATWGWRACCRAGTRSCSAIACTRWPPPWWWQPRQRSTSRARRWPACGWDRCPAIAGTGCRAWRFRPRLAWPACAGAASRTGWKPLCGPPCWQA